MNLKATFAALAGAVLLTAVCSAEVYATCASPTANEGTRQWSSSAYSVCNGSSWLTFLTSGTNGACSVSSQMQADTAASGQYDICTGATWQQLACTAPAITWTQVVPGYDYTCGLTSDGNAWCWGYNGYGQIGDTTTANKSVPTLVNTASVTGTSWTAIYPMNSSDAAVTSQPPATCGIRNDGSAWCWGYNNSGNLGVGNTTTVHAATTAVSTTGTTGTTWSQVRASYFGACGIRSDGTGYCWGSNQNGVGGNGASSTTPKALTMTGVTGSNWTNIYSGSGDKCGLRDNGTIWCWGYATSIGDIGNGTMSGASTPTAVSTSGVSGTTWTSLSNGGSYRPCAIRNDGTAWCWGEAPVGNNTSSNVDVPTAVTTTGLTGTSWTYIGESGPYGTCGIRSDGTGWCWGDNTVYEMPTGTGTTSTAYLVPTAVSTTGVSGTGWTTIDVGYGGACGLRNDGTAWCWGVNTYGENGNTTTNNVPTQVPAPVTCTTYGSCSGTTKDAMDYDFTNHRQIICDGTNWIGVSTSIPPCGGSQTYSYTGSTQTFTLPSNCTSFTVHLWGAGGAGGATAAGGGGGYTAGSFTGVTGGNAFTILVGGGGSSSGTGGYGGGGSGCIGSANGAAAGGRSAIQTSSIDILDAGGGGGGIGGGGGAGGAGGGSSGANGGRTPGYGGTQTGGGANGFSGGVASAQYTGGYDTTNCESAGGGGYYGGGDGWGGGGGSGYIGGGGRGFTIGTTSTTVGSGTTPGSTSATGYVSGIAVGGAVNSSGGNGSVYITYP